MSLLNEARAFLDGLKGAKWDAFREGFQALPEALAKVVAKMKYDDDRVRLDQYFVPENAGKVWDECLSPSGLYKLKVTSYSTTKGGWSYTQGLVFKQGSDQPIFEVRRNYSAFPFSWVENHQNGHAYLICGEDYQGQTVLELDTGERRDFVPTEEFLGHGFCWSSHDFNAGSSTLTVAGCHWACPYEYRFYDFSDPMGQGWPQLELVGKNEDSEGYLDADNKEPTFEADGTIVWYQTKYGEPGEDDDYESKDDEGNPRKQRIVSTRTFKREGLKLIETAEWVAEDEQQHRAEQAEGRRRWDEWCDTYRKTDPLYLRVRELSKEAPFKPSQYFSSGVTHDKWCPDFKVQETRVSQEILSTDDHRVEIEIAAKTGPVKLILVDRKENKSESQFFMEHTVESIDQAFAAARRYLGAS